MLLGLSTGVAASLGVAAPGLLRIRLSAAPQIFEDADTPGLFHLGPVEVDTPQQVTLFRAWQRDGQTIPGARAMSYRIVAADAGTSLRVALTLSSPGHAPLTVYTNAVPIASAAVWALDGFVIQAIPPAPPMPRVSGYIIEV